jgi:hypothetical protein
MLSYLTRYKRQYWLSLMTVAALCVVAAPCFAQGKGGGKGGGGGNDGGGEDPPAPLPAVRYEINRVDFPADSYSNINDVNNFGDVVGWVAFTEGDGSRGPNRAYLANPAMSQFVLLDSIVDTSNLPANTWLASVVGINDHGVVVGYTLNDADERYPFAVDLALERPVVDLLPRTGFVYDYASKINNRGEIVGVFLNPLDPETTDDNYISLWYLDPLLYGDPATRIARDADELGNPLPFDMSQQSPVSLESIVGPTSHRVFISNPSGDTPTFIGGTSSIDSAPFRLDISTMAAEFLTDFTTNGVVRGMDASGALVGVGAEPGKGKKITAYGYRYIDVLKVLPEPDVAGCGPVGDVLFARADGYALYRDWQDELGTRSVSLNDLVTGNLEDLAIWNSSVQQLVKMSSGGVIALRLDGDQVVTLFEVPAP